MGRDSYVPEVLMPRLRNEIGIDAGADEVWGLVGDLAAAPEWVPGVVEARVEGDARVCRTAEGREIHERVTTSDGERTLSYQQSQVPMPVEGSRGTLRVVADGTRSRVEWEAEFEAPDEVAAMVDGFYKQTLDSLKTRVESGRG
jgi:carbon monoxide dehydrogenase subunit G